MKGFVGSIEKAAQKNETFRTVLYTAKNCQLVVMSLKGGKADMMQTGRYVSK